MQWFRVYNEILDDPKIAKMDGETFRVFIYLLALSSEVGKDGFIDMSIDDISWRIRIPKNILEPALADMTAKGIVEIKEDGIIISNWKKRQFPSDNVGERVKRFREKQGNVSCNVTSNVIDTDTDTDTDTEEEKHISSPETGNGSCPHQKIIELYHQELPQLPRVKVWTNARKKTLQARWREDPARQSLDWWRAYFASVRASPFLLGENDRQFRADLEWLILPRNMPKVLEGKYTTTKGKGNGDGRYDANRKYGRNETIPEAILEDLARAEAEYAQRKAHERIAKLTTPGSS